MSILGELFAEAVQRHQGGDLAGAESLYRQIIQADSAHAHALHLLGIVLILKGQLAEAAECLRQTLRINPKHADAHNVLGIARMRLGQQAEALESFRQAVHINPNHAEANSNLGNALAEQGLLAEAGEHFRQALRADPGNQLTLWNRGLLRLLQGDLAGGWPDYERRWAQPDKARRGFPQPRWDGAPLGGKTILVYAEQGFGDTIQFVRYLPMVRQCGGKVVLECQAELSQLFGGLRGVDQLVNAGQALPPFDTHIPLLSLPGIFGTTEATIPAHVPYLTADPERVEYWQKELARLLLNQEPVADITDQAAILKIGIAWQGNPTFRGDRTRSLPLVHFEALARIPGVRLISLQKGAGTEQMPAFAQRFSILDLSTRLEAFSDTAAVMKNLDLIVSSCTVIPHLAGALALPVWTALQFVPDWRWQLNRADSPWYPTMRLFRQNRFGDWGELFERIAGALARAGETSHTRSATRE